MMQSVETVAIRNIGGNECYKSDITRCLAKAQIAIGDTYRLFKSLNLTSDRYITLRSGVVII